MNNLKEARSVYNSWGLFSDDYLQYRLPERYECISWSGKYLDSYPNLG